MVFLFYQKQLLSTMTSPARDGVKNGIPYVYQIHRCTEGRDRGSLSAGLIYIDYDFDVKQWTPIDNDITEAVITIKGSAYAGTKFVIVKDITIVP